MSGRGVPMREVLEYLSGKVFYLATTEGDQPHVRPMGALIEIEGKAYICTNNQKNMFKQIIANPKVEFCAVNPEGGWLRVTCTLVHDPRREAKAAYLKASPGLEGMYSLDDGIFEVLYIKDAKVVQYKGFMDPMKEWEF